MDGLMGRWVDGWVGFCDSWPCKLPLFEEEFGG